MTAPAPTPVTYRVMHHIAFASNASTPDMGPGVVVYEHWTTNTAHPDGTRTEVWDAERKEVATTLAFDDEWGTIPGHPDLLDEDDAHDALWEHGFVLATSDTQWVRQDDGQWRAVVDYYDPTP